MVVVKLKLLASIIYIQEYHLAVMWAFIYSQFLIYEEAVLKPIAEEKGDNNIRAFKHSLIAKSKRVGFVGKKREYWIPKMEKWISKSFLLGKRRRKYLGREG